MKLKSYRYLTEAQLRAEMSRCEFCEEKPCEEACPSHCSPADFIMAARGGQPQDYARAAASILEYNPLGHVCGVVCPDSFCMAACAREKFDAPVEIPGIQAAIIQLARKKNGIAVPEKPRLSGKKVAVVGAGPAGLAAAACLGRKGHEVDLFDAATEAGGACLQIPDFRFPKNSLQEDIRFILSLGAVSLRLGHAVNEPEALLGKGYDAVLAATGLPADGKLGIPGEELAIQSAEYLTCAAKKKLGASTRAPYGATARVAVIGGGAIAADCAVTARKSGASSVEVFVRRTIGDMPLTPFERAMLIEHGIDITTRTRILAMAKNADGRITLTTAKVEPKTEGARELADIPGTAVQRPGFDVIVMAIGSASREKPAFKRGIFFAGDRVHGASTVVEAVASGKNAAAEIDRFLTRKPPAVSAPGPRSLAKSRMALEGMHAMPVSLETDFFGVRIPSPFLLSAAPHTDGFDQMRAAYEAGWAGGVMKTAFDNVPIHIPAGYMFTFTDKTFGNADNVSGHSLDRVCAEIERLRELFPDRLTLGSTGGPVTGRDELDRKIWQANSRKLERAGAMGVEFSLSCPQGGDGTEGDIVSQSPAATAKVIDWVMETSDPGIPKLFKLTAAVTSITPIMKAVRDTLARHPGKKAGVTLANSFPVLAFRPRTNASWDEGVVVGMSGEGVVPISYLTLATAAPFGVPISGNGGVMDYAAAANFLALGAKTVQVCTVVMRYGLGILHELSSGLSHLMNARGIRSISELTGRALPRAVTPFPELSPVKQISMLSAELCQSCGNCTRNCGYQALTLDENLHPVTDPAKCIGCTLCAKSCFAGALFMRDRGPGELSALREH